MGACSSSNQTKFGHKPLKSITTLKKGEIHYGKRGDKSEKISGPESNSPSEKIEMFLSMSNILSNTTMYKIRSSICNNRDSKQFIGLGETDSESGNQIIFNISIVYDYYFEKEQLLRFEIISENINIISVVEETVGKILGSRSKSATLPVNTYSGQKIADMTIDCKNASTNISELYFNLSCSFDDLKRNSMDIFYLVHNFNDKKNWRRVYKSGENLAIHGHQTKFPSVNLLKDEVCGDNIESPILIEFYDFFTNKIGCLKTTLSQIQLNQSINIYRELPKDEDILFKNVSPIGSASISVREQSILKFVDYLNRGMQINLIVGIDFTTSNEVPSNPASLHYMGNMNGSPYERAIQSCGKIVAFYDFDQKFPVYGFGGVPPGKSVVSHCFNLNFSDNPNVDGLDGIISCYRNSVSTVRFSAPTYFAPLIKQVSTNIKNDQGPDETYYVLMILTDGIINDMDQTCDVLVDCDILPLSVIIIGIGNADFTNMKCLDGDEVPLTNIQGVKTRRDLVQFVEFGKYQNQPTKLAEEVLQEIPRQVEEYYKLKNID